VPGWSSGGRLGEHAPSSRGEHGQIQRVGTVPTKKFQLIELSLEHLRLGRGGAAAQPHQTGDAEVRIDVEQPVELGRPRRVQQQSQTVIHLGSRRVACRADPAGQ
jgi:hypothetical protein